MAEILAYELNVDKDVALSVYKKSQIIKKAKEERFWKELKEQENIKEAKRIAAEIDAATIFPDEEFMDDLIAIKQKNLIGEEKSKAHKDAFKRLLNRIGHENIISDFWTLFKIVFKKTGMPNQIIK